MTWKSFVDGLSLGIVLAGGAAAWLITRYAKAEAGIVYHQPEVDSPGTPGMLMGSAKLGPRGRAFFS